MFSNDLFSYIDLVQQKYLFHVLVISWKSRHVRSNSFNKLANAYVLIYELLRNQIDELHFL